MYSAGSKNFPLDVSKKKEYVKLEEIYFISLTAQHDVNLSSYTVRPGSSTLRGNFCQWLDEIFLKMSSGIGDAS
jgi:hypothetical protein